MTAATATRAAGDYRDNPKANRNRAVKVTVLEDWCRARRIGHAEAAAWEPAIVRKVSRDAGVHAPSDDTWAIVLEHLARGQRRYVDPQPRPDWLPTTDPADPPAPVGALAFQRSVSGCGYCRRQVRWVTGPDGGVIGLETTPDPAGRWLVDETTLTARQAGPETDPETAPDAPESNEPAPPVTLWAEHYPTCEKRPRARAEANAALDAPDLCERCEFPLDTLLLQTEPWHGVHPSCDRPSGGRRR